MAVNLSSPDADIRFMAINDLYNQLSHENKPTSLDVQAAVVNCLSDRSSEVQSLATRVVGLLSAYSGARVLELTLSIHCPDNIKAMALKSIFSVADLSQLHSTFASYLQGTSISPVISTPEGVDALYVYASRSPYNAELAPTLLNLLGGESTARVYDALALVLNSVKESEWNNLVLPKLNEQKDSQFLFGMTAKLAPNKRLNQFLIALSPRCFRAAKVHSESEICESALYALAQLVTQVYQVGEKSNELIEVATKALQYHEYGYAEEEQEEEEEDDENEEEDEDIYSDYDTSFVDESSSVRQGGALLAGKLIGTYGINDLTPVLVTAARRETNTLTKSIIYTALFSNADPLIAELEPTVAKDIQASREKAANAGISMFSSVPSFHTQFLRLVKAAVQKYPNHSPLYLASLESLVQNSASQHTGLFNENDVDTIENILRTALITGSEPLGSNNSVLQALRLIVELKLAKLVGLVISLLKSTQPIAVRAAALITLGDLSHEVETSQPLRWNEIVDEVLPLMQSVPALRANALQLLTNILKNATSITAEATERIIFSVSEILQVEHSPANIDACIVVLSSAPLAVGPRVAHAVVNIRLPQSETKKIVSNLEKVLLKFTDNLGEEKMNVSQWAVQNQALQLLAVVSVDKIDSDVSPEVRAAASISNLKVLDNYYHFSSTNFADLNEDQQRALLTVYKFGKPDWYQNFTINSDLEAKIFGTYLATQQPEGILSVPNSPTVKSQYVDSVFTAFCVQTAQHQPLSFFISIMKKCPQLRSPSGISETLTSSDDVNEFVKTFLGSEPEFLVDTLKRLPLSLIAQSLGALHQVSLNSNLEASVRVDALDTMRWALVQQERYSELREAVLPLLIPDPTKVSVINIGPFKHRVDSTLSLRLEAVESLLAIARRSDADPKAVEVVVKYSLADDPAIKILAYRLLSLWGKSNAVRSQRDAINAAISELKPPKESAGKVDHERFQELKKAVHDAQLSL